MPQDQLISTRKLAALLRKLGGDEVDRQAMLDRAIDAMRAIRRGESTDLLDDPQLRQLLEHDDALGRISQALSIDALEQAYRATTHLKRKFRTHEIPIVTQLFTPRWVVEFLLQNSLGRLWLEMHPESSLRRNWQWLIDSPAVHTRPTRSVTSIRVLDPACGTMNFGLVALEMLCGMYREELGRDMPLDQIAEANLFGVDLDPVMIESARKLLALKGVRTCNLHCGDALFGPLPSHFPESFDIVATNPPYLSARNLPRAAVERMKRRYPRAWRDQYACFIERAIDLLAPQGRAALLTMQSFMFTAAFEPLRRHVYETGAIECIEHIGPRLFDVGNPGTLQTVAFVVRRESSQAARDQQVVSARGTQNRNRTLEINQQDLCASPRASWCYWLSAQQRKMFATLPKLRDIAPPRQGLATTDNARFVRFWWEVQPTSPDAPCRATPQTWFPYVKSGRFRRWYEAARHRVNWRDNGAEIKQAIVDRYPYLEGQWQWVAKNSQHYFKRGVTYSYLTSKKFSARLLEAGAIFDVAGSSLFPDDPLTMLAILNSSVARDLLAAINPTVNFQVGDLAELPLPDASIDVKRDVLRVIELTRSLDRFDETSPDFVEPLPSRDGPSIWNETHHALAEIENRIDETVSQMYGRKAARDVLPEAPRFDAAEQSFRRLWHDLRQQIASAGAPLRVSLEKYRDFYAWHVRLYQRRPILWMFGRDDDGFMIAHDHATPDVIRWIARKLGESLPRGWQRHIDDGVTARLAPLSHLVADASLRKSLERARGSYHCRHVKHVSRRAARAAAAV